MTRIAVIGAGSVGRALADGLERSGHDVVFGVRRPDDPRYVDLTTVLPLARATEGAEVVVLAIPAAAATETMTSLELHDGQVLVDATNAVGAPVPDGFPTMGALVASLAPSGVAVVKAFNTVGAEHMRTGAIGDRAVFLPVAGDPEGVEVVVDLARGIGFDAAPVGDREQFSLLEEHARLWIRLAFACGWGRDFAFGVLRP